MRANAPSLVLLGRAAPCREGADDGHQRQHQAEVGVALEQAEVADRVVVEVADLAGAGLLLAAGGAQGAKGANLNRGVL